MVSAGSAEMRISQSSHFRRQNLVNQDLIWCQGFSKARVGGTKSLVPPKVGFGAETRGWSIAAGAIEPPSTEKSPDTKSNREQLWAEDV